MEEPVVVLLEQEMINLYIVPINTFASRDQNGRPKRAFLRNELMDIF